MKKVFFYLLVALGALFLLGIVSSISNSNSDAATVTKTGEPLKTDEPIKTEVTRDEVKSNWDYTDSQDEMDGEKRKFAISTSTNQIEFQPPYNGGSKFNFAVRKTGKKNEIYLSVDKGQFMTSIMDERKIRLKFDDESPMSVSYTMASDGRANMVFLGSVQTIISKLKSAKKLKVDAEFYQEGRQVANFDVAGLKW